MFSQKHAQKDIKQKQKERTTAKYTIKSGKENQKFGYAGSECGAETKDNVRKEYEKKRKKPNKTAGMVQHYLKGNG